MVPVYRMAKLMQYHIINTLLRIKHQKTGKVYAVRSRAAAKACARRRNPEARLYPQPVCRRLCPGQYYAARQVFQLRKLLRAEFSFNKPLVPALLILIKVFFILYKCRII